MRWPQPARRPSAAVNPCARATAGSDCRGADALAAQPRTARSRARTQQEVSDPARPPVPGGTATSQSANHRARRTADAAARTPAWVEASGLRG
jgi:hypothetical protein